MRWRHLLTQGWRGPTWVRKGSETALVFDGWWLNASNISNQGYDNAYRINGRHSKGKVTNILFCDGHAESISRSNLPMQSTDFTLQTLGQAPYNVVKWRIDQ